MGSTDKDYRTFTGDVERASGTNFPEEYVDNETKKKKCEVIGKIRSPFLAVVRLSKLRARHHGGPDIKKGGGKEDEYPKASYTHHHVSCCNQQAPCAWSPSILMSYYLFGPL